MSVITPLDSTGRPSSVRVKLPSEKRSSSRSATRALDVMEYLGNVRRPVRAVEISRALGMHPSTTNQLLKTMVDSSHLLFDARILTYSPSPRLTGFGEWLVSTYGPDERLRALVRDVGLRTGMVTTLTTVNDIFMQIIELATTVGLSGERGQRVSLFGSTIGSAYLSTLDETEIRRLMDRARVPQANNARIFEALSDIRRDGFADGPTSPAVPERPNISWSIAVPLPAGAFPIPLVLGLAGPEDRIRQDRKELYHSLQEAIRRSLTPAAAA